MQKKLLTIILMMVLIISSFSMVNAEKVDDKLLELQSKITDIKNIDDLMLKKLKDEIKAEFKDYNSNEWYAKNIAKLIGIKGISGYPDKTIKPNGTITRAEFTALLIKAIFGIQKSSCSCHWVSGYIDKAVKEGILMKDQFKMDNIDKPITREEIANMIERTVIVCFNELYPDNIWDYQTLIKDYDKITVNKGAVLTAYAKGIITGYPDGTFKPQNNATRAEASTVIIKLLDKNERTPKKLEKKEVKKDESWRNRKTVVINGYTVPVKGTTKLKVDYKKNGDPNYLAEISLNISIWDPLEEQWAALEIALLSKFDKELVRDVIDYIKKKTERTYNLETKKFYDYNKNRYIWVDSPSYNGIIGLDVFYIR